MDRELTLGFMDLLSKLEASATALKTLRFTMYTVGVVHQHESRICELLAPPQSGNSHLLFAGIESLKIIVKIKNVYKYSKHAGDKWIMDRDQLQKLICAVLRERTRAGAKVLILQDPEDYYYQDEEGSHCKCLEFSAVTKEDNIETQHP